MFNRMISLKITQHGMCGANIQKESKLCQDQ